MSLFDAGAKESPVNLAQLLQVEDSPELLALSCPRTQIPVWSVIRIAFLREVMGDLLFASRKFAPPSRPRYLKAATALGRTLLHNARTVACDTLRSDVLINSDSIGDTLREGRWFNRHADPFGDLPMGQAVVLSDLHEWRICTPRHNERILYHAPIQVGAALIGRMPSREAQDLARAATTIVCDRAREILGWRMPEHRQQAFVRWAACKIAGLPFRYSAYARLLQRVRPKLILVLAGCYGAHAPLIAAARDAHIITGEFQHGSISAGHDAYNFAPSIFASEAYRRTLPRYLLTYGSWWNSQVTAPVECVTIGNPMRAERDLPAPSSEAERRHVLVLSDGIEFALYLDLAQSIAKAVATSGLEVVLRPHPLERESVADRFRGRLGNVKLDVTADIYQSFARAHTVVSEVSTGLFEAVGLVNRIVMLDTAKARFAYPNPPFMAANSVAKAIELVGDPAPPLSMIDLASLWEPDWQENYAWFLRNKVGIGA